MTLDTNSKERRRIRRALIKRQGFICFYCDVELVEPPRSWKGGRSTAIENKGIPYATVDHLLPRRNGGANALNNLVLCCIGCHRERHKGETWKDRRRTR